MKLKRKIIVFLALVLSFTALFAVMMFNSSAANSDVATEYGTIPAADITDSTTVALFAKTGVDSNGKPTYKYLETGDGFIDNGIDRARQFLNVNTGTYRGEDGNIVVYLLKDCVSHRGKGWQAANRIDGTVTVDLGTHNLTARDPRLIGFDTGATGDEGVNVATAFEFKNGTITTSMPLAEVYGSGGIYTATKEIKITYDNIIFNRYDTSAATYTMINAKGGYDESQKVNLEVYFKGCTFNYSTTALTVINDTTTTDNAVNCTVKIDRDSTTINANALPEASGMNDNDRFGWDAGIYGTIPLDKIKSDTNFVTFAKKSEDSKYTFIASYGSLYSGAIGNTQNLIRSNGAYIGGTAAILMINDYIEKATSNWNNAAMINGTLVIDLGGKKLNWTSQYDRLFGFLTTDTSFDSNIVLKNGELTTAKYIAEIWNEGKVYTGTDKVKTCKLTLEDLAVLYYKASDASYPASHVMIKSKTHNSASTDFKANFNVDIKNCNINYSGIDKVTLIADYNKTGNINCDVTIEGGNISGKKTIVATDNFKENDSFKFIKNENGERTTMVFDYAQDCSVVTYMTDDGEMHLAAKSVGNRVTYVLSDLCIDGYGYIPLTETNKTFSVFDAEKKLHLGSYDSYNTGALERVRSLLNPFSTTANGLYKSGKVTMVLRKDYNHTDNWFGNYAHIAGTYTLDLCGHTIVQSKNGLFNFIAKKTKIPADQAPVINDTATIVKNGTILTRSQPIVKINNARGTGNFDYTDTTKIFDITFNNVTFDKYWATNDSKVTYNPLLLVEVDGDLNVDVNATFNDCSFTSCDTVMFDASLSNTADVDITINGGVINTNDMSNLTILKSSDKNDTLTFDKSETDESYTSLVLPTSAGEPTESYNNGNLVFVKVDDGTETKTYRLREKTFENITYSPKMSITLDRNIYINVYVPKESLVSFTLGDKSYENLADAEELITVLDGEEYYLISTPLPAAEAASEIVLSATITLNDGNAVGKFTFSIPKYAKKVFNSGTLVEKQVLRDVLSYIRSAYVYFETDDKNAISSIDTLIGKNYDVTSPVVLEGSVTSSTDGLKGASLNLSEKPGIRFYVDDNANVSDYSFYYVENGKEIALTTEDGSDSNGKYIEVNVYAYAMCETINYRTAGGAEGSYHIASYHAFAKTENDAELVNLVERFWKYCQSARDYRNSVTVTVNYVDALGNTLGASKTVCKAPGEEVTFISPAVSGYYTRQLYVKNSSEADEVINVVYNPIPENVDEALAAQYIKNISAWGDSITEGSNSNNLTAANNHGIDLEALGSTAAGGNYVQILQNLIATKVYGGITVYGLGVGSETTATIAARANTEHYYFYINEAVTLTDAQITIDLQQNKGLALDGRLGVLRRTDNSGLIKNVTMTGKDENGQSVTVEGLLTCVADAGQNIINCDYNYLTYTFTRTDGKTNKVTFDQYTRVVTRSAVALDGNTCIIFMGENDGYNKDNATIIAQQEEILAACGIDTEKDFFLIISSTSKTTAERQSLNDALTARWGDNYINMGNVLNSSRDSYEFAGYSEEAIVSVLDNIIEGSVTELLLGDGCHPNAVGYTVIANAMFERLFELGAFDAIFDYYDSLNGVN